MLYKKVKCLQKQTIFDDDLSIGLKYAYHTTLVAVLFKQLQLPTSQLQHAHCKLGMKINVDKCKINSENLRHLSIDKTALEKVDKLVFLGSLVPKTTQNIKGRISLAATAFENMKKNVSSTNDR